MATKKARKPYIVTYDPKKGLTITPNADSAERGVELKINWVIPTHPWYIKPPKARKKTKKSQKKK